jgi:branched-chain amino acid transport system substrate-binding protein
VVGRDDVQGKVAADLLAERWRDKLIAILHDGEVYGREAIFEAIEPGEVDYWAVIQKMQTEGVEGLDYGGYVREVGLIMRQAKESGYPLQLVAGEGIANADFGLIAGRASDGTLMTGARDPSANSSATAVLRGRTGAGNQSAYTASGTSGRAASMRRWTPARLRSAPRARRFERTAQTQTKGAAPKGSPLKH